MKFRLTKTYDFCDDEAITLDRTAAEEAIDNGAAYYLLLSDDYETEAEARKAWSAFVAEAVKTGKAFLLDLTLTRIG